MKKKISYWASPPAPRDQQVLFTTTPDSMIAEDAPVRFLWEILGQLDWSKWEQKYNGELGQPPIHPRVMAGIFLHGLTEKIRSSREFQKACELRIDFMWLAEGFKPSHNTFCRFRKKFSEELKDLFKQVALLARKMGLIALKAVAFDGTRVKANNSRYNTTTASKLESELAQLTAQFDQIMAEIDSQDVEDQAAEKQLFDNRDEDNVDSGGSGDSPTPELSDLKRRQKKAEALLEEAERRDEARRQMRLGPGQVPRHDIDSRVMENKEGGYAPNYTPTATTDGEHGIILHADVLSQVNETPVAIESVDEIKETLGEFPDNFLTDSGNNDGPLMAQMEERDIVFFAPVKSSEPQPGNPVLRDDLTKPVPQDQWSGLPRNNRGKLDQSCFVYDKDLKVFWCPNGEKLGYHKSKKNGTVHRCTGYASCPLVEFCVDQKSKGGRTVTRSKYHQQREATVKRMATDEGKLLYSKRPQYAETPFGIIKRVMGFRQFLLTGLDNVRTEWRWATIAYNLKIILREWAKVRAQQKQLAVAS